MQLALRLLCFALALIFATSLSAQTARLDSFKTEIEKHSERDSLRVHALVDYAAETYHDEAADGLPYIREAIEIAQEIEFTKGLGFSYTAMSGYYYIKGKVDSALVNALAAIRILDSIGDKRHILAAQNNLAMIYNDQGKTDLAIETYLKIYETIENQELRIQHLGVANNLAYAYQDKQDYENARKWFLTLEKNANILQEPMGFLYAYNGLTGVELKLENYAAAKEYGQKAYEMGQKLGAQKVKIESLKALGKVHKYEKKYDEAIANFRKAMAIADTVASLGNLLELNALLAETYEAQGDFEQAFWAQGEMIRYEDSLYNIEKMELIESVEAKFQTEKAQREKQIAELETDKAQQAAVISEQKAKDRIKWLWILGFVSLGVVGAILMYQRQFRIKKENELLQLELEEAEKRYKLAQERQSAELRAIKAQMNPHFIFNALNSIQGFMFMNDKLQANAYLGKFSRLMRQILDMSNEPRTILEEEIKLLNLYLELEALRLDGELDWAVEVDESVEIDYVEIPSMLIQPYAENAIKHGLLHKRGSKSLKIHFSMPQEDVLLCTIWDNGVGRKASAEFQKNNRKGHKSFATSATAKRLELLNDGQNESIGVKFVDLYDEEGEASGTLVEVRIPV